MTEVYANVPAQYLTAVIVTKPTTNQSDPMSSLWLEVPTEHQKETAFGVRRSNFVQNWQREVGREVQGTSNPKHLKMCETTERGTKARINIELIHELAETHESDYQGKMGRVKPKTTGAVGTMIISAITQNSKK